MGKTLVLGGTRGLGRSIAIEAMRKGDGVVVVGRSAQAARADVALAGAMLVAGDFRDAATYAGIVEAAEADHAQVTTVVWVGGTYHRGRLADMAAGARDELIDVHFRGPTAIIEEFHRRRCTQGTRLPYDLVVVASVLSYTAGKPQAAFCGLQAAKAHFARSFSYELARDLPGSATLIVHPSAMKTGFFDGFGIKTDGFMEPDDVARLVHHEMARLPREESRKGKGIPAREISLKKSEDGGINVLAGSQPIVP